MRVGIAMYAALAIEYLAPTASHEPVPWTTR